MKKLKFTVANSPFVLEVPETIQKQAEDFLALAKEIPLNITINGGKYILMQESDLDDLLSEESSFGMYSNEDLDWDCCEDEEDDSEEMENEAPFALQEMYITLITGILDEAKLNTTSLSIIKDVVDAHLTLASVREIFGEDED